MWKKLMAAVLTAGFAAGTALAAPPKAAGVHGDDPALPGGAYSATAKSLACGGCAGTIEEAMRSVPGVERASVDAKTGTVDFTVKDGASVRWSDLQKALKAASDKMGMGADYTLSDFKMASTHTTVPGGKENRAACCPGHK
ncbi:MAG TPA: heavy metal-associated domain-containing protein [Elusimicrobiota bacterium]|nr:heavy metal-associated domain-containing protein [Elusimicrobiota bacterium]